MASQTQRGSIDPSDVGRNRDLIALGKVSYAYPTHVAVPVLRDMDLAVHPDQYLLICGASGSGKSSLIRTFNGLIPHFYGGNLQGTVTVDGRATVDTSVAELFHQVGMVFQNPKAQLFNRTVAQEIVFGMESLGLDRTEMKTRLEAVVSEMALGGILQRSPQSLSGGEQQWVAIAAILVLRPRLVVLDEPMANLDAAHIQRLRDLLIRLRTHGMGITVCEHRLVPTLPEADRVMVIQNGQKLLAGTPDQVARNPNWPHEEIELPLATRLGLRQGIQPLPRDMAALAALAALTPSVIPTIQSPDNRHTGGGQTNPTPDSIQRHDPKEPTQCLPMKSHASISSGRPMVALEKVSYRINRHPIIHNVTFNLYAGQCTALVGANGAGKTTLVKLINGLIKPGSGRIHIMGQNSAPQRAWQVAGQVGTAFQNPNSQFFKLTVEEEILVGPLVQNCRDDGWIGELVEIFGLAHLLARAPFKLSGGEKKRVAFAAALAAKPQVLVLDEPTAGQDSAFRQALIQCLQSLTDQGTAVLVVTHALNFLERLTDRWLVLAQGELIADATPKDIMTDHRTMQRAGLMPTETFLWQQMTTSAS